MFHHGGSGGGLVTKSCPTLVTPWPVACHSPLSMEFSRKEYRSGLPFLLQGMFPTQARVSCAAGRFFTDLAMREALCISNGTCH